MEANLSLFVLQLARLIQGASAPNKQKADTPAERLSDCVKLCNSLRVGPSILDVGAVTDLSRTYGNEAMLVPRTMPPPDEQSSYSHVSTVSLPMSQERPRRTHAYYTSQRIRCTSSLSNLRSSRSIQT